MAGRSGSDIGAPGGLMMDVGLHGSQRGRKAGVAFNMKSNYTMAAQPELLLNLTSQRNDSLNMHTERQNSGTKPRISFGYKFNSNRVGQGGSVLRGAKQPLSNGNNERHLDGAKGMAKFNKYRTINSGSPYDESRALAARFLNQKSLEQAVDQAGLVVSPHDLDPIATSHRSKIFETKKLSVLNIANKVNDHVGHLKTILGHGPGTQLFGSLAKHQIPPGGSSVINGSVRMGIGAHAGSGVIIENERSRSRGKNQNQQALQARQILVQQYNQFGHERGNPVPSLLVTPNDREEKTKSQMIIKNKNNKPKAAASDEKHSNSNGQIDQANKDLANSNLPDIYKKFFFEEDPKETTNAHSALGKTSKVRVVVSRLAQE